MLAKGNWHMDFEIGVGEGGFNPETVQIGKGQEDH